MTPETLKKANIDNLCNYWKRLGSACSPSSRRGPVNTSNGWPFRAWWDYDFLPNTEQIETLVSDLEEKRQKAVLPLWHDAEQSGQDVLKANNFALLFAQAAMVLPLRGEGNTPSSALTFKDVETDGDTERWVDVASRGFGYEIDTPAVRASVGTPGLRLVLATEGETPVATGVLFENSGVAGMHMVAVSPTHRRRGFARQMMFQLLAEARKANIQHATLQASTMGEPLYHQLGFERQFTIRNYSNMPL